MQLEKEEKEWMTNIRKSVVNHLRIAPMIPEKNSVYQMIKSDGNPELPRDFTIEENTLLGACSSQ